MDKKPLIIFLDSIGRIDNTVKKVLNYGYNSRSPRQATDSNREEMVANVARLIASIALILESGEINVDHVQEATEEFYDELVAQRDWKNQKAETVIKANTYQSDAV